MEKKLNLPEDAPSDALRAETEELEEVIGLLGLTAAPVAPPARVKEELMRSLTELSQPPDRPASELEVRPGISLVRTDELAWQKHPWPGVRFKTLPPLPGSAAERVLLELGPGARFPDHTHDGVEDLFVLRGTLTVAGRTLRTGDYCRSETGTRDWGIVSEEGSLVLVSTTPPGSGGGDRSPGSEA